MTTAALAPPGARDFDVYRLVEFAGVSTRVAAEMFGVSQTRIMQLRDKVAAWVSQQKPVDQPTKERSLQLAQWEAGERMRFLYQTALQSWRESQGPETTQHKSMHGGAVTVTRTSQGKTAYLNLALRIAERLAKLPSMLFVAAEATTQSGDDGDVAPPSKEDCSPAAAASAPAPQSPFSSVGANTVQTTAFDQPVRSGLLLATSQNARAQTVQPAATAPSRQARRARERQREQALARHRAWNSGAGA